MRNVEAERQGGHGAPGARTVPEEPPPAPPSAVAVALVVAGAIGIAALVGIRGDFPLSDDWSYAYTARALCEEGEIRFLPWTGASLLLQAGYGAMLCRVFDFSFTVLRISTVAVATIGMLALLGILRRLGTRGAVLALAVAVCALNPLYTNLAFTFMTDVPFTALATCAGYFYVRGLREDRRTLLLTGSLWVAAALMIRQHGLLVALAAALTCLFAAGSPTLRFWKAITSAALPVVVFLAYHAWLFATRSAPAGYEQKLAEAWGASLPGVANAAFRGLAYLGLFLLPLTLGPHRTDPLPRRLTLACVTVFAVGALALWLREGASMFYLTNVLYDLGLGALTLRDTLFLNLDPIVAVGPALSFPLTVAATLGAGLLASAWIAQRARMREPAVMFLVLATLLLFVGTLLHTRYYFDRYLLPLVPFAVAATVALGRPSRARAPALLVMTLIAAYAVAGTHDYLAWNRARHAALDRLEARGVPPTSIDGGVEFNAWRLAPGLGTWPSDARVRPGQSPSVRSWWWVVDDRFVLSFRPLPGYRVADRAAYRRWLPPGRGQVLVLERQAGGRNAG